jgi:putative aminopeptidase FrvX
VCYASIIIPPLIIYANIMTESIRCNSCQRSFDNLSIWNNHVKAIHQKSVGVTYSNGTTKRIERGINGTFMCICNNEFSFGDALRRHAKKCRVEEEAFVSSHGGDEGSEIDVEINDLPFDCIGVYREYVDKNNKIYEVRRS